MARAKDQPLRRISFSKLVRWSINLDNRLMLNLRARPSSLSAWYLLAFALGLLGLALHIFLFWPGGVSVDTRSQFRQATTGLYDSWHPPSMAFLWRLVNVLVPGTLGMFILQTLTLFVGLLLFWDIYRARSKAVACAVFLIPLTPMFLGISGMIWKDIQVAGFGLLAYGIFLSRYERLFKARVVFRNLHRPCLCI